MKQVPETPRRSSSGPRQNIPRRWLSLCMCSVPGAVRCASQNRAGTANNKRLVANLVVLPDRPGDPTSHRPQVVPFRVVEINASLRDLARFADRAVSGDERRSGNPTFSLHYMVVHKCGIVLDLHRGDVAHHARVLCCVGLHPVRAVFQQSCREGLPPRRKGVLGQPNTRVAPPHGTLRK